MYAGLPEQKCGFMLTSLRVQLLRLPKSTKRTCGQSPPNKALRSPLGLLHVTDYYDHNHTYKKNSIFFSIYEYLLI